MLLLFRIFFFKGKWEETRGNIPTMELKEVSTEILEKVVKYFHYKKRWDNTNEKRPKFDMSMEHLVPILLAAHFLQT